MEKTAHGYVIFFLGGGGGGGGFKLVTNLKETKEAKCKPHYEESHVTRRMEAFCLFSVKVIGRFVLLE